MKKILVLFFVLAGIASKAQYIKMTAYGYDEKRHKADSVEHVPVINDTLLHTTDTSAQIRIIGNNIYWHYGYWRPFVSAASNGVDTIWRIPGIDSIYFSIDGRDHSILDSSGGKLNIVDTTGHWVYDVYKRYDSFFYAKDDSEFFIGLDSAGATILLQTNGVDNGSQTLLNLQQGRNMTLTDNGTGTVTFDGFDTAGLRGVYMDTVFLLNDTTMRACKGATCWDLRIGSMLITFEGDTVTINNIKINKRLRIPLTDTTHAKKGCGNLIYDTIREHYYGDVCINGVHNYWGCLDCDIYVSSYAKNGSNDSTILTLNNGTRYAASDNSGSGGSPNSNIGTGYRWAVPNTNNIKTVFGAFAITIDSITNANALTFKVDTSTTGLHTENYFNTKYGTGTVTSVATNNGTGITGGTITTTGTLAIDTGTVISTKANVNSKQITINAGTNVSIAQAATQNLGQPPSWTINASDSASYHTITQITDSSFKLCRLNGTCDTVAFASGAKVDSIWRTPGKDSIQFSINGRYHAIRDSIGAGAALTTNAIGYGIANLLGGTVDSLSYVPSTRTATIVNSLVNGSTGINQLGLYLKNGSLADATTTGVFSPSIGFYTSARKTNATAETRTSVWAIKVKGITGASGVSSQMEFSYANAANSTPIDPSSASTLAFWSDGNLYSAGNAFTGGTAGNGTFWGSSLDASTTSGTSILINASNSSNSTISATFASQQLIKFFQATRNVSFQNGGTIPADPADGGQFNIYQNSGMTGISTVSGTGGTANLTGGATNFINQVQVGDQIAIAAPNAETLTVLTVTDATHIVFTANMANTHTNAGYTIIPATVRKFTVYNNGNSLQNGKSMYANTITAAGTTGNKTIDKPSGTVNIAAGGTTVTVTNSLCTASSIVFAVIRTNDATAQIKSVVPAAGSFVINIVASTGEVSIGWIVHN